MLTHSHRCPCSLCNLSQCCPTDRETDSQVSIPESDSAFDNTRLYMNMKSICFPWVKICFFLFILFLLLLTPLVAKKNNFISPPLSPTSLDAGGVWSQQEQQQRGEFLHLDFNLWIFQFSQAWARRIVLVQFPLQSLKSSVLSLPLSSLSLSLSYLSAYLSIYLLYLSMIYLSIYLSAVSIYLSTATIYLAIYQSIYLSI